uniref:Uncharacterized protein n=1 Tax=Ascaris lumbricoides TaxID=6252 RepID=A0A0M3HIK7_ASCLU
MRAIKKILEFFKEEYNTIGTIVAIKNSVTIFINIVDMFDFIVDHISSFPE